MTKLSKEQREGLILLYVSSGRHAIMATCRELGVSPQTIANHASNRGLYRRQNKDITDTSDPRWARARAVGKVIA